MTTVYLALGSNIGDSQANISQAIELLGDSVKQIKQAPIYASKAVGYTNQPDFLNTALTGQTDLEPQDLLAFIKDVEHNIGRTATFHHGPREIDIDIIFYGDAIINTPTLTIPHPDFRNRDFVLKPLSDLKPDLMDPVSHKTVSHLLGDLNQSQISILK